MKLFSGRGVSSGCSGINSPQRHEGYEGCVALHHLRVFVVGFKRGWPEQVRSRDLGPEAFYGFLSVPTGYVPPHSAACASHRSIAIFWLKIDAKTAPLGKKHLGESRDFA